MRVEFSGVPWKNMFVQSLKLNVNSSFWNSCKIPTLALEKIHCYSLPFCICSDQILCFSSISWCPAISRKGFYSMLSSKTAPVCCAELHGEFIYLKTEFILYTVIKTVGEPWDGFIPSTSKCSKYEHPSENSFKSQERKITENCTLLVIGKLPCVLFLIQKFTTLTSEKKN